MRLFVPPSYKYLYHFVSLAQLLNNWFALIHPFRKTDSVNNGPVITAGRGGDVFIHDLLLVGGLVCLSPQKNVMTGHYKQQIWKTGSFSFCKIAGQHVSLRRHGIIHEDSYI